MTSIPATSAVTTDHPFPPHLSRSTCYQRGCRCRPCRDHNAARQAAHRATRPKLAARPVARQLKVRPAPAPAPRRQGTTLYGQDDTVGLTEWARLRDYNVSDRSYGVAV